MFIYAGKTAKIVQIDGGYTLDIDGGAYVWEDFMFDPDYKPDNEPLSIREVCLALLNGETLTDKYGCFYKFDEVRGFLKNNDDLEYSASDLFELHRLPLKYKRDMTTKEMSAWAESDDSLGWMVRMVSEINCLPIPRIWLFPRQIVCILNTERYQRAKLLPDLSGIDESTIQGFEVEE
jgi:hypothetical protein